MGADRNYQTQAIVIKQSKFGETDRIITFYTAELGKLRAVARGIGRPGSKLGGNVEPITYSLVMLATGRNLDIVTQSQTMDGFLTLKGDLKLMAYGLYILELVDSFTVDNNANRPLFDLLLDSLRLLTETNNNEIVLRYFELHLLQHLGYRPELYRCVRCNSPLRPVVNYFSSGEGGVICPRCGQNEYQPLALSVDALKVLRLWQDCDYLTARRVKVESKISLELQRLLQGYIGYLLQRTPKSIAWLEELKKMA